MPMNKPVPVITVFGSSSPRTPLAYRQAAAAVGSGIAQRGWILRNGAGADGCMGASTDAALAAGGEVQGVNLQHFVDQGFVHPQMQDMQVAHTMRERKQLLGQNCAAYVILPGGPGTWEELWEVAVERQIGIHAKPLLCCDVDGYWQGFAQTLQRAENDGLLYGPGEELLELYPTPEDCLARLDALLA